MDMKESRQILPLHNLQKGVQQDSQAVVPKDGSTTNSQVLLKDPSSANPLDYKQTRSSETPNSRRGFIIWGIRYGFIIILVAIILLTPILIFRQKLDTELAHTQQYWYFICYLFAWLEFTWIVGCLFDIIILAFPYIFRFFARYINPAHRRYWRVFRPLRMPFTMFGTIVGSYSAFYILIDNNYLLAKAYKVDWKTRTWDNIICDILEQVLFWVVLYLAEKAVMIYIAIHYHYGCDQKRNIRSKEMHAALAALYEASIYMYPRNSPNFVVEDTVIRNPDSKLTLGQSSSEDVERFLGRLGYEESKKAAFLGNFKSNSRSHWLSHRSAYAVVERALSDPKTAAALATRIWKSFVIKDEDVIRVDAVVEALGPYRRKEAADYFKTLDENESNDVRLEEMVWTVVEAGRVRRAIYRGMADMDHCLNTLEWVTLIFIGLIMAFFILVSYVPAIDKVQQILSFSAIGLSFAAGRTVQKFLCSCIFILFEHPFDIGDRVQVYNFGSTGPPVSCFVVHQSILYTIFRRVDNGTMLQITNERLSQKRIENISRSGANKESRTICIDINTTFTDITNLRSELEAFLEANPRDYMPQLGLSITELFELNKMEITLCWTHKNNWENEMLCSKRSTKFMCALVEAIRKVPIVKAGGVSKLKNEAGVVEQVQVGAAEERELDGENEMAAMEGVAFIEDACEEGDGRKRTEGEAREFCEK